MTALSALLARDRVVPLHKLDEAIQRQVINGGDFETNLLEVGGVAEDTLTAYCAAVYELEAIGRDAFATVSAEARARLTKDEVLRLQVIPVAIESGALLVATAEPLSDAVRTEIEHLSGMRVEVRITTGFRFACVLGRAYGQPLSPRFERLMKRLESNPSGAMPVSRPSSPPSRVESDPEGVARIRPSVLAALSAAVVDERETPAPDMPGARDSDPEAASDPHWADAALEAADASLAPSPLASMRGPVLITAGYEAAPDPHEMETADAKALEAHVPDPTQAQTRETIAAATSRDAIIGALLDYAETTFTFVALFVVHGDVAEGLDARGEGVPGDSMRQLAVPLDAAGAFRSVKERGEPHVGPMTMVRTDTVIQADLGRDGVPMVALLPVHIGGRVALIVWADGGRAALDLAKVDALAALCVDAAHAFERVIVDRKRRRAVGDAASNAAAAIAAMDLTTVTTADISRRFADQRGQQALRAMSGSNEPPVADDQRATQVLVRSSPPPAAPARAPLVPREEPDVPRRPVPASSTQFARGGRVPISIDVIGPLPGTPPPAETHTSTRAPRAYDPRREPDEGSEPPDETLPDDPDQILAEVVRTGVLSDANAHGLLTSGERALAPLFRRFPGPTTVERTNSRTRMPPASEVGPLLRVAVMLRNTAAPSLIQQLESNDPERRFFATLCLTEAVSAAALHPLFARLFDTDFPTSALAVDALKAYRRTQGYERVLGALRGIVPDANEPADRRRIAANVLGELRDAGGVPALISALDDRDGALSGISRRSLVVLTRQDFGQDTGRWDAWWQQAREHHRIEWLIDALLHAESTLRHEASEELKKLTGQFFGYYFNLPRRERERAHQRYVEWWQREGALRFHDVAV